MIGYRQMEHKDAAHEEPESMVRSTADQEAREREALRRRVRESLLRCPDAKPVAAPVGSRRAGFGPACGSRGSL